MGELQGSQSFHHCLYARVIEDCVHSLKQMEMAIHRCFGSDSTPAKRVRAMIREDGHFHELLKGLQLHFDEEELEDPYPKVKSYID